METSIHHNKTVVDQFSKQAIPFMKLSAHLDAVQMLIEIASVSKEDEVLDVACGPGLVLCEFAKIANKCTGIDITEAMLQAAQKRQNEQGLTNLVWNLGNVAALPFENEQFSLVISRYSFHHFQHPEKVFSEMYRVCKKGGRILIADVALPFAKVALYNTMEKLRDDSHTSALSFEQFERFFAKWNLKGVKRADYKVPMELEKQLAASFFEKGNDIKIRNLLKNDLSKNEMGVNAHLENGQIWYEYPISVFVGIK